MKKLILLSTSLIFIFASCNKEVIIEGRWLAESYQTHSDSAKITSQNEYFLTLDNKKQYSFSLDANICGGEIIFKKDKSVVISDAACTLACCDSQFPSFIISNLQRVNIYELTENQLIFKNKSPFLNITFKKK